MRHFSPRRGFAAALALMLLAGSAALAQPISPGGLVGSAPPPPGVPPADLPSGRLSMSATNPVAPVTAVTGATSIFYVPYNGNQFPLWDGTKYTLYPYSTLANISTNTVSTSAGGGGPAAVVASACYDLFVWFNGVTQMMTLTRGPAYTNCNARGAGSGQVVQAGIIANSVDIPNGPAAGFGVLVGSMFADASGTYTYLPPTAASGFGPASAGAQFNYTNIYNRLPFVFTGQDNGASYTYTSNVIRQARASGNAQATFMKINGGASADQLDPVMTHTYNVTTAAASGAFTNIGWGIDSTTAFTGATNICGSQAAVAVKCGGVSVFQPPVGGITTTGKHTITLLEQGDNVNANTIDVNSTDTYTFSFAF